MSFWIEITANDIIALKATPMSTINITGFPRLKSFKTKRGITFWAVRRRNIVSQEIELQKEIIQKCRGNMPSLKKILKLIMRKRIEVFCWPSRRIINLPRNRADLKDCTRKYFIDTVEDFDRKLVVRIKIKIKVLSSIDIHRKKNLGDLAPRIRLIKRKKFKTLLLLILTIAGIWGGVNTLFLILEYGLFNIEWWKKGKNIGLDYSYP